MELEWIDITEQRTKERGKDDDSDEDRTDAHEGIAEEQLLEELQAFGSSPSSFRFLKCRT